MIHIFFNISAYFNLFDTLVESSYWRGYLDLLIKHTKVILTLFHFIFQTGIGGLIFLIFFGSAVFPSAMWVYDGDQITE